MVLCRADIWDVLRPFADLLAEYSAGNATIAAAGQGIAGYMAQVLAGSTSCTPGQEMDKTYNQPGWLK